MAAFGSLKFPHHRLRRRSGSVIAPKELLLSKFGSFGISPIQLNRQKAEQYGEEINFTLHNSTFSLKRQANYPPEDDDDIVNVYPAVRVRYAVDDRRYIGTGQFGGGWLSYPRGKL